jgi:uncharacterized protein (TIGR03435 family)
MLLRLICIPAVFLALAAAGAQAPEPQNGAAAPVFDVTAIHLHEPQPHEHNSITSSPFDGHFLATNVSVMMLIHWAYEMPETRILGAPSWTRSSYFNVEAKADPALDLQLRNMTADTGRHEKELMVQAMLADRFGLVTHMETRELPIYELVVGKKGANLGPVQPGGSSVRTSNGQIEVQAANSVSVLAEELSKVVGRDVVDQTGITGRYDLKLLWTPDDAVAAGADAPPPIYTALEEQLGLRLVSAKGPVKVLIVDRVSQPSAN